ncbi:2-hydroxyacid dehydrogenase [Mycobacterium sp.]|jgi:lactate dehydrogenase-like 2-hydroxyacid dehydrogenase|uniref:2-hydroxyacid dehydrogenase n=1 Tax=Mycobacterium sp. TaxID=1785 RepID=UPI002D5B342C|nr:2-hydroxyacid dehydrogenase [Mycobacterium sp.]HZA09889.1 2-hydroxyacid dehydrogenase [Mycobacterium sp.]
MSVLQFGRLEPSLAEGLAAKYQPLQLPAGSGRPAFLAEHGPSITVIVDGGGAAVDADLMAALPNLGAIVHYGVGYDNVDIDAARRLGIGVSNTPDVLTDTVADTAVGLMLATMRRLCEADRYLRAGRWESDGEFPLTRDVNGTQVGVLGLGRIGSAIAARLRAFDCAIAYHNRHQVSGTSYRYAASPLELAESVDVLVVAAAGGKGTERLVSRAVLEALGQDGYLVNVARGSVVDQDALVEMLAAGRLAGAGLDVYTDEPYVPTPLRELDNVVLLPHVGSATTRTRAAMTQLALRNLDEYLMHATLTTPVVRPQRKRC